MNRRPAWRATLPGRRRCPPAAPLLLRHCVDRCGVAIDIYSRYTLGWMVAAWADEHLAERLYLTTTCRRYAPLVPVHARASPQIVRSAATVTCPATTAVYRTVTV